MSSALDDVSRSEPANFRVLVAGIGNIFLGSDAFGAEVVRRLAGKLPQTVQVEDFGIRGFDMAYALIDNYETIILVDAIPKPALPGCCAQLNQIPTASIGPTAPVNSRFGAIVFQDDHSATTGECTMCLAIPGKIFEFVPATQSTAALREVRGYGLPDKTPDKTFDQPFENPAPSSVEAFPLPTIRPGALRKSEPS